ncbi:sulfotransferase family protein [Allohahella sp. A8]|uniref:sulfotransferase family protein n=1 Tax=Allohahella sp. A8 TaxID=3141461 RepID=UPI003A7F6672
MKKTVVVVLAMHRSGSSALTRGLCTFGVELGDNLMPPAKGENDKGFWEDISFHALNEQLLKKMGTSWDSPAPSRNIDEFELIAETKAALSLLQARLAETDVFGFKDPRTSILLPFWKEVFKQAHVDVKYVFSVRQPQAIAQSLLVRDGIPLEVGLLLYIKYVSEAMAHTHQEHLSYVSYGNLIEDPAYQIKRLALKLGFEKSINEMDLDNYCADFISKDLSHFNETNFHISSVAILNHAERLYQLMLSKANDELATSLNSHIENSPHSVIDRGLHPADVVEVLMRLYKASQHEFKSHHTKSEKIRFTLQEKINALQHEIKMLELKSIATTDELKYLRFLKLDNEQTLQNLKSMYETARLDNAQLITDARLTRSRRIVKIMNKFGL